MRLFKAAVYIGVPIIALVVISLFFIPPLRESASSLICENGATLIMEGSPNYSRNVIFTCVHADGTRADATTPIFVGLCKYMVVPYVLLLMVLWIIGRISRLIPLRSRDG